MMKRYIITYEINGLEGAYAALISGESEMDALNMLHSMSDEFLNTTDIRLQ